MQKIYDDTDTSIDDGMTARQQLDELLIGSVGRRTSFINVHNYGFFIQAIYLIAGAFNSMQNPIDG